MEQAIYDANAECSRLDDIRKYAESEYAEALAETLGIKIGSIVSVTSLHGCLTNQKKRVTRYRICAIRYKGYDRIPLALDGYTIRKDGTQGEKHEIWQDWTLEPAPERGTK